MDKIEIFDENGYLKSEFINPNYRGLVGWPCDVRYDLGDYGFENISASLACVDCGDATIKEHSSIHIRLVKIKQFTPAEIPVGEVVLGYDTDTGEWHKIVLFDQCYISFGRWICRDQFLTVYEFPTPHLIAETAEDAERLKDWDK